MKSISASIFIGVLLALPLLYTLDNDPDHPLSTGSIAFILFLTIGAIQLLSSLIFKKRGEHDES
jgi:hypothetical protein